MAEIGPVLPPGFKLQHSSSDAESEDDKDLPESNRDVPQKDSNYVGPALPPGFKRAENTDSEDSSSDSDESVPESNPGIGPVLPPGFQKNCDNEASTSGSLVADSNIMGPALPPGFVIQHDSDSDDDNAIGPMPYEGTAEDSGSIAEDFEKRAQRMRKKLLDQGKDQPQERETWMLELPPEMSKNIGLGPRKFKAGAGGSSCGDRSVWTDTPADREKRAKEATEGKVRKRKTEETSHPMSARDKFLSEQVEEYNKSKRSKSLLAMHETKLKKKKKKEKKQKKKKGKDKEADRPVRQEFDRERDLQVNRFDEAMRKSVIKRSQQLGGRFAHGSQQFM